VDERDPTRSALAAADPALVAGVMHELKHPLTGIRCGLELLERAFGPALAAHPEWAAILRLVEQLGDVVEGWHCLVDARHDAPAPFAVEPVVHHAATLMRFRLRALGSRFAFVRDGALPPVHGSRRALLHALLNLLSNALDATHERGGERRIEVRARAIAGGRAVEIRVGDDGAGIPPAAAARLFQAGVSGKRPGEGTGLGLHLSRALLERSGATLRLAAASEPDRARWAATEFVVELPTPEDA
jgi:C4-dicarboxylate-specific signal transduction histidine kinase